MAYAAQPKLLSNESILMEQSDDSTVTSSTKAPFYLRCAAILIDYVLLLLVPVGSLVISQLGEGIGNASISNIAWYCVVILWMIDFLVFPLFRGQTFGKMLVGIRMIRTDGRPVRLGRIFIRNVIGYLLTTMTFGLGFLISVINKSGRSLHDYVAGTVVVYTRKRRS